MGYVTLSAAGVATHVSFKLPAEMATALDELAEREGVARSELMRRAVAMLLDPAVFAAVVALRLADTGDDVDPDPADAPELVVA